MTDLLPPWPLFAAFLFASLVLAVAPGPGVFYIVTRGVVQGRGAGLASVAGVALGNLVNAIAASLGLAALFAISAPALAIVKYAGALYLIYLGIRALRSGAAAFDPQVPIQAGLRRLVRDGFLVALLNPKTALFFAAFLPQFIGNAAAAGVAQNIALGFLFVFIAAVTDTAYATTAGSVAPLAQARGLGALGRYLAAGVYIGLGVFTAISGVRSSS